MTYDHQRWKMFKFIRDPRDRDNTIKVLEKHFGVIKSFFIYLQSKCLEYPELGKSEVNKFMTNSKFLGNSISSVRID